MPIHPDLLLFGNNPVASFAIGMNHVVAHFNAACARLLQKSDADVLGTTGMGQLLCGRERPMMTDLIADGTMETSIGALYQRRYRRSLHVPHAYQAEGIFPKPEGTADKCLFITAAPICDETDSMIGAIERQQDRTQRRVASNGNGIPKEVLPRIIDCMFTTQPIEKEAGPGLSLSYSTIPKHHLRIDVEKQRGAGTRFGITLPVLQTATQEKKPLRAFRDQCRKNRNNGKICQG